MKSFLTDNEFFTETAVSSPRVTREMVHAKTLELAMLAGRESHEIRQADYEGAKLELTGESDFDRQQAVLNFSEY